MPHVFIRIKVKNYSEFKEAFDAGAEKFRQPAGSKGGYVFRDADDPNMISIMLGWDDTENLKQFMSFMKSPAMDKILQEGSVLGLPEGVYILGQVEEVPA
jgi:quinol monooxygenase YgiN